MLTRRTVILTEREAVYGTDPVLTGSDGLLAYDVDIDIKGEVLMRDVLRDTLSPLPHVIGMKEVALTFKTELKGGGVSGTRAAVPEIDPLLHACGFGTAAITGTDLTYSLNSDEDNMGSCSLKVYKDGNLHKITGARGTFKLVMEAGKYGVLEWEIQGLYNAVSAADIVSIGGMEDIKPPICYNASFQIAGFSPVCSRAQVDMGNNVVRREDLNATDGVNSFRITGREPKLEFDADAVVEASNPFWGDWSANVVATYGFTIGSTVGNKINMSGYFQYETNKYGDSDGVSQYECAASMCSSNADTDDDEFVMKFA